jgi:L-asparaginase
MRRPGSWARGSRSPIARRGRLGHDGRVTRLPATPRVLWTLSFSLWLSTTAAAQPIVRVIATGGTISNHSSGRLSATALVASAPQILKVARVETETFAAASSLELSLSEWAALSARVRQVLESGAVSGVVITSGSDSLEELAWFLDLTVPPDRPVVVTGAMRRPSEPDPDGPRNLADAVRVAVSREAGGRGTLVVMAGLILRARDATKVATGGLDAFGTFSGGPAGRVQDGRVRFARGPGRPPSAPLFQPGPLPRVDVLLTYQQAPGDLIDASLRGGARGLVIASAGAGAMTAAQVDALQTGLRSGIPVVVSSRVPRARLLGSDVPQGTIAAGALSPVKARILLMLALARGDTRTALQELFAAY